MTSSNLDDAVYASNVTDKRSLPQSSQESKETENPAQHLGPSRRAKPRKFGYLTLDVGTPLWDALPPSLLARLDAQMTEDGTDHDEIRPLSLAEKQKSAEFRARSISTPDLVGTRPGPARDRAASHGMSGGMSQVRTGAGSGVNRRLRSRSAPSTNVLDVMAAAREGASTLHERQAHDANGGLTTTYSPQLPSLPVSITSQSVPVPSSLPSPPAAGNPPSEPSTIVTAQDLPAPTTDPVSLPKSPRPEPPSIDTKLAVTAPSAMPLSADAQVRAEKSWDLDIPTVQQQIMSRPSFNLQRDTPSMGRPAMDHGHLTDDEEYYEKPGKQSFWAGFRRSFSANLAKLRNSKSGVEFPQHPPAGSVGSDYHSGQGDPSGQGPGLPGKHEGISRSISDNSMPRYSPSKPLPELPSVPEQPNSVTHARTSHKPNSPSSHGHSSNGLPQAQPIKSLEYRRGRSNSAAAALPPSPYAEAIAGHSSSHPARVYPIQMTGGDDAEQIALLIRKHKEANVDRLTGSMSIPRRSSSYVPKGTMEGKAGTSSSSSTGEMGVSNDASRRTRVDSSEEEKAGGSAVSKQSKKSSRERQKSTMGEQDASYGTEALSQEVEPLSSPDVVVTHYDGEPSLMMPSEGLTNAGEKSLEYPSPAQLTDTSLVDSPRTHVSTDSSPSKRYRDMDPELVGRLLFEDALPEIPLEKVSEIIGKPDDYHKAALQSFIQCFDFTDQDVDEGFRAFANHLFVTGESQVINRILTAYAQRYWTCNPRLHSLYPNYALVDSIMASLMMLNTDLHRANIGARSSQKITKKQWVNMVLEGLTAQVKEHGAMNGEEGRDALKKWTKAMDVHLRRIYDRTAKQPLPQREIPKPASDISPVDHLDSALSSPEGTPTSPTSPILSRLRRDESSLSLASTMSTGTMFSVSEKRKGTISSFMLRRKGDRGDIRHVFSNDSIGPQQPLALSLDSQLNLAAGVSGSTPPSLGRHSTTGAMSQPRSSSSSWGAGSPSPARSSPVTDIQLEGQLIRKHLKERDEVKAKHRKWIKLHCVLQLDVQAGTLELCMYKLERNTEKDNAGFVAGGMEGESLPLRRVATGDSTGPNTWLGSGGERIRVSSDSAIRGVPRLASQPPQTFNLLHSLATPLPPPGYSQQRPHVFTLRLFDGQIYLFHGFNAEVVREWVKTINFWAARKSKEPFPGSGGNTEYGWGPIVWERAQQRQQEQELEHRESGERSSGEGVSPSSLSPQVASHKYASSMRSFTSGGSTESGRSVATVPGVSGFHGDEPVTTGRRHNRRGSRDIDRKMKKMKISEWMPPVPLGKVMSTATEEAQLEVWRRQQDIVSRDLEEHSSYRDPMEKMYAGYPALRQKATANWMRKQRWLMREYEKYGTYAQMLRDCVDERSAMNVSAAAAVSSSSASPVHDLPVTPAQPSRRRASVGSTSSESRKARGAASPNEAPQPNLSETRGKAGSLDIIREVGGDDGGVSTETKPRPRRHSLGRLLDFTPPLISPRASSGSGGADDSARAQVEIESENDASLPLSPIGETRDTLWSNDFSRQSEESWRTALTGADSED
ncbi:uncharacterized protein SPPG_05765 [Spizellomyces punctatus DAOM BR117]|uniref:SEC7 domain-containing protein n=1 Tax=Spizellomyces punctatus (strain DAOM BR117) TaxID=645134 RepID=A0A0L0HDH8_SPIPD|nr:uncharacterized protein SPPG_05765 [Spizellomyces punctatus DAOM BR117]KNC98788.1 hypothetical protein SPPG_05765 [Spizellomyces punctatus DAOM BR117]|eukprot:XP_016606828.1 hypothetical protein SPPG_05765 [Spizellomyces punctatus DAOM BR117]